jgi:hypothetical protein
LRRDRQNYCIIKNYKEEGKGDKLRWRIRLLMIVSVAVPVKVNALTRLFLRVMNII